MRDGGGTVGPFNREVTIQGSMGCKTKEGNDPLGKGSSLKGVREDCLEEGGRLLNRTFFLSF